MAQHEVSPQGAAEPQGPLQIHRVAGAEHRERGTGERLGTDLEREAVGPPSDDRQADAVHRDASADIDSLDRQRGADLERRDAPAAPERPDRPNLFDDPGEHQAPRPSRTMSASIRRSSPTGVVVMLPSFTALLSSRPTPPTTGVAWRPPTRSGATYTATRSTSPASRKDAWTSPPPSTSTARISRAKSSVRSDSRFTRPSVVRQRQTEAPEAASARTRSSGALAPTTISARSAAPARMKRAWRGVLASVSRTTRSRSRGHGRSRRTVSSGSSRRTVPTPTRIASDSLLSR